LGAKKYMTPDNPFDGEGVEHLLNIFGMKPPATKKSKAGMFLLNRRMWHMEGDEITVSDDNGESFRTPTKYEMEEYHEFAKGKK
jgi:hypothetical protein